MSQQKGQVLILTLLLLSLLAMIILTQLQQVFTLTYVSAQRVTSHQAFYALIRVVSSVQPIGGKSCYWQGDRPGWVLEQLKLGRGCQAQPGIYYGVEDIGRQACLGVKTKSGWKSTRHQRLTVLQMADGKPYGTVEVRNIFPDTENLCPVQPVEVRHGISSWQYRLIV